MIMMKKLFVHLILWGLAFLITILAAYYQRITGPTYPRKINLNLQGKEHTFRFIRSAENHANAVINLGVVDTAVSAELYYRRYPVQEEYKKQIFSRDAEGSLKAEMPAQAKAGKLEYFVLIHAGQQTYQLFKNENLILRYKGRVPSFYLNTHIFLIFFAMFFSNLSALLVLFKMPRYKSYLYITFFLFLTGGMILGPVVQYYAFDTFWSGIPFGWDLTDNKMLLAFIFWVWAFWGNIKRDKPGLIILAALITLIIFSIPHSMFGSELDYGSGRIIQG
jgi:hypothetical protein